MKERRTKERKNPSHIYDRKGKIHHTYMTGKKKKKNISAYI
jgi:hypothetical protein